MILGSLSSTTLIIVSAAAGVISFAPEAVVRDDTLYLGDVVDMGTLPADLRDRSATLPLMKLPKGSDPLTLRTADIASRARALMPALAPWFQKTNGIVLVLRRKADPMRLVAGATQEGGIAKDDRVSVTLVAGIYTIKRQGIAMSDAKIGERLFVKTEDRKALSAICCGE
jgi:hypothetical protein